MSQNSPALVLNASGEPMRPLSMKRAMRLVLLGRADIVESEGQDVKTSGDQFGRPSVIRLKKYVAVPRNFRRSVNNTMLLARDGYACQYCGRKESELKKREHLNRDHIIPLSRGGKNTWENCVTACSTCNGRKDSLLLSECGMKLLSVPTEPHFVYLKWAVRKMTPTQQRYITKFFGEEFVSELKGIRERGSKSEGL